MKNNANSSWHRSLIFAALLSFGHLVQASEASMEGQWRADQKRVKEIAANPKKIGSEEIAFLVSHPYFQESVEALIKADTEAAREALWKLALGGSTTAAHHLSTRFTNKLEAIKLLQSASLEIQQRALISMAGCALDQAGWEEVKRMLASQSDLVRSSAARVVGHDSGSTPAPEKVQALIKSLAGLEKLQGADKLVVFWSTGLECRASEIYGLAFVDALVAMRGLDVEFLRTRTPEQPGTVRDSLLIARASKGDASASEELSRIVREQPSAPLRCKALVVYDQVGTTNDLPILEAVAREDSALVKNWRPHIGRRWPEDDIPRDHYPLREMAERVIGTIQKRSGGK